MSFPPGNSLYGIGDAIRRCQDALHLSARHLGDGMGDGMAEPPRDPLHGSDEAKLRALAADLVRRRGAGEASRLADIFVGAIQMEMRK